MNAYHYDSALICVDCANKLPQVVAIRESLAGPFPDGGGVRALLAAVLLGSRIK